MGAIAVGNVPLHHFITDLQQTNRSPLKALESNISSLQWKTFALSALEKISYVALIAIMATILSISYSSVVLTGTVSLVIAGMALSTPLIAWGLTKFATLSQQFSRRAEMESQVLLQYKQIENWTTPQINEFLAQQGLNVDRIPTEQLRQINANDPLRAILPLIARYNYFRAKSHEVETRAKNASAELEEAFRKKEAETGQPIDPQIKQKIRFESNDTAWRQHEQEAVPLALNAAVVLQIMQDPTTQDLDVQPQSFDIPRVATCVPKSFAERMFGRIHQPRNDDYLLFHPGLNRPPLQLQEIEQNIEAPRNLQLLLFPNAIRA